MKKTAFFSLSALFLFSCDYNDSTHPGKDDVLTFRNNYLHTGVFAGNDFEQTDGFNWIFETNRPIRSTPAVFNHTVYFGSCDGNTMQMDQ